MQKSYFIVIGLSILSFFFLPDLYSQQLTGTSYGKQGNLVQFAKAKGEAWNLNHRRAVLLFEELKMPASYLDQNGRLVVLQRLGHHNRPVFYTADNVDAARIISSDQLWTKENDEPWLSGEGIEINLWDGGAVLDTHDEFQNSTEPRIFMRDYGSPVSNHSTHVAGTMAAAGTDELAKGMAGMATIQSWNYNNDIAEMAMAAAEGIMLSNHSYGSICGWDYNSSLEEWCWYGDPELSANEDYQFGFYDEVSADMDYIAWSAPNYLIVKSAGNDRQEAPPDQPIEHFIWDDGWISMTEERSPDGGDDGYDCLTPMAVSKNILTVGAVDDDKLLTSFSAFGPTDDGRIKPDVVASGMDVYSCIGTTSDSYDTYNGTSMAAASATGSTALLLQLQEELQPGVAMRSSTLKGLLIHTAEEMGNSPGPDYQHGWGLLNIKESAELMKLNAGGGGQNIRVGVISEGESLIIPVETTSPLSDLKITLCWTDPPGAFAAPVLNSRESKLVNDLDLEVIDPASQQSYFPWSLSPEIPDAPATKEENHSDNVEQILLTDIPPGSFHIKIGHTGVLTGGFQSYSLIISGISSPTDILPPEHLQFYAGESSVTLNWNSPELGSPDYYKIYRNDLPLDISTDTFYTDLSVETNNTYAYYISAVYNVDGTEYESLGTNRVSATPRTLRAIPFIVDFEDGYDDMLIKSSPEGWCWGDSDSLSSYYLRYGDNTTQFIAIDSYSAEHNAHITDIAATMPLKLAGFSDMEISFEYMFRTGIYDAIDVLYVMYKLPEEMVWHELEQLTTATSWTTHTIPLPDEACVNGTQIGFYYDDLYMWGFGAGLDNISISGTNNRTVDLGIVTMISPTSACTLSDNETVTITIRNEGDTDLLPGERISLQMSVSNGIQSEEDLVLTDTLFSNDVLEYQWNTRLDLSEPGSYEFDFLLSYDLDYNVINNSFSSSIEVTGPVLVSILNEDLDFCEDDQPVLINVSPAGGLLSGPGISGLYFNPEIAGVGTHQVIYTYSDPSGCQGSDTAEMVVQSLPQVSILNQDLAFCEDDPPVLINVSPAGGLLSGPGISGLYFNPEIAGVGTHVITYTYSDPSGCTASTFTEVVVNPAPTIIIITEVTRLCKNDSPFRFEVNPPGGILTGAGIIDLVFNPKLAGSGIHLCTYTYTDTLGCSGADSATLQVFENPWIDLGSDQEVGLDDTIELEPMGDGTSFLWYNGSTEETLPIITSEMGIGEYNIWVEASNLDNCKAIDSMLLTINISIGETTSIDPGKLSVYPNPFATGFYLKVSEFEVVEDILLIGPSGKVYMNEIPSTFPYFDVSGLPAGLYILKVQTPVHDWILKIIKAQ